MPFDPAPRDGDERRWCPKCGKRVVVIIALEITEGDGGPLFCTIRVFHHADGSAACQTRTYPPKPDGLQRPAARGT